MRFSSTTQLSFGYKHNGVALFDFVGPSAEKIIEVWDRAGSIFFDVETKVLIRLDRRRLKSRIIPNSQACPPRDGEISGCIPYCEVWYPGEIPLCAISCVYRLPPTRTGEFKPEPIGKTDIVTTERLPPVPQTKVAAELRSVLEAARKKWAERK